MKIAQKLKAWECPKEKHKKKTVMKSLEQNFRNLRKVLSQIFAMIMWSKFHQNRPKIVAIRDPDRQTDRQTHTHTHRHTHRQGSFRTRIFSHTEMTEDRTFEMILSSNFENITLMTSWWPFLNAALSRSQFCFNLFPKLQSVYKSWCQKSLVWSPARVL